jgi:chromosome segregation ATPase
MSGQITRRLKPEEEELRRKHEELAAIRATLAEQELELVDLRGQLAAFEGRYLRQVGTLYAELDEWKARISELRARLDPSPTANAQAEENREQARQTYEEAHGKASETRDFSPSPELRSLFREVAKGIHPDLSKDAADHERRTRFMAEANRAYEAGDAEALRRILDEYQDGADVVEGEGIGAELIRIIRQISLAKSRVSAIEQELASLRQGEIALLKKQNEDREQDGGDLLAELAAAVREQIVRARKEYEALAEQEASPRER